MASHINERRTTMFPEIYELAKTTTLTLLVSANSKAGTLTLCVKPTPRKGEEATLAHELSLTATPDEFEQGFPGCLTTYATQHKSLVEQTAATTAVMEAAKQAQVAKGAKAATAASKGASPNQPAAQQSQAVASAQTGGGEESKEAAEDEAGETDPFA
jgi:PRTRC genetic system protein E